MRHTHIALLLAASLAGGALLAPAPAHAACCYFAAQDKDINQPGQKAFITWDPAQKREAFTVQPKFEGNAMDFGMVVPTPSQPKLDEMPRDFFKDLAIYTILMPMPQPIWLDLTNWQKRMAKMVSSEDVSAAPTSGVANPKGAGPSVRVLESGVVGSLDYKIIVADDASGLYEWLEQNKYVYGGDKATLGFYIEKKWFFTVMKIDPKQMKQGADGSYLGEVTPTRFTFQADKPVYPLKITQISVKDATEALIYVAAPQQMDLVGDMSWQHSFRVMFLTFMLGCSADEKQQKELNERNAWISAQMQKDPRFQTTKLEWAKKLGDGEIATLDDPLKNYGQMGGGDLPPGSKYVTVEDMLEKAWRDYKANTSKEDQDDKYARDRMKQIAMQYPKAKGGIIRVEKPNAMMSSEFMWLPNREAPDAEVKGLTRLKGHLRKGQWVTKFRKVIRKDEMSDDLQLVPVGSDIVQEYVRIMPTSPP